MVRTVCSLSLNPGVQRSARVRKRPAQPFGVMGRRAWGYIPIPRRRPDSRDAHIALPCVAPPGHQPGPDATRAPGGLPRQWPAGVGGRRVLTTVPLVDRWDAALSSPALDLGP